MNRKERAITLTVFLLGIFMGAIDSGIVSPSRTIIQNGFGVSQNVGVWMITIYTLAYAVSMPIASKLSDRYGRKRVYLISISIFTVGSILCGLTNFYGTFSMLLGARVIQAIGGGGIVPIATAFIGRSFSEEKRGAALGFVGAIYGVATILGPTIGSSIIDIVGQNRWGWIFFVNVPVSIVILALGATLGENVGEEKKKMDIAGTALLTLVIVSLMYALTNIDFFNFKNSISKLDVWPYLAAFVLLLPVFVLVERKADDPVLNIKYFKDSQIAVTLILGFITGCGLMGVVFVPQFAENVLKLPSGRGGYMVTLMSLFAGISAPMGGKLIDRLSAKFVILTGFTCTALGTGFLGLYVSQNPSFAGTLTGLALIGFGMGFTMGTPLNYLMLLYVPQEESASGLSTLSLIRSMGVTVSPNIMIGFIANAGKDTQSKLMAYMQGLAPQIPGGSAMKGDMGGGLSGDMIEKLKASDVTTIVDNAKAATEKFLDSTLFPQIKTKIAEGMSKAASAMPSGGGMGKSFNIDDMLAAWKTEYLNTIDAKRGAIESLFQSTLNGGFRNMFITATIIAVAGVVMGMLLKSRKNHLLQK